MGVSSQALTRLAAGAAAQVRKPSRRPPQTPPAPAWRRWLAEPRSAVLLVLGLALLFGGGRKLLQGWRARGAVGRLNDPGITPEDIEAAAEHGRAGLMDLFRILGTDKSETLRQAAGHALAVLWAKDELIAEEEKALIRRGYTVDWHARRRYPRGLNAPIPIVVTFGVPFLREGDAGIGPANLEWSQRILGGRRATLETFSAWTPGPPRVEFTIIPGDFDTNGPHKLVLEARARTVNLTESWALDLPHMPFTWEFDPRLDVEAIFTLPDETRGEAIARAVRLDRRDSGAEPSGPATYLDLTDQWALRNPPVLAIATPLPCDLAHRIEIEFEGIPGRFPAGTVVLGGQGPYPNEPESLRRFPLGPLDTLPPGVLAIDHPGPRRLRAILTPDPDRGWADPAIRSLWPGTITTGWIDALIIRR
jgi:hypothetical protein